MARRNPQQTARVNVDDDVWTDLRVEAVRTGTSVADYLGRLVTREVERLRRRGGPGAEGSAPQQPAAPASEAPSEPPTTPDGFIDRDALDEAVLEPPPWEF